MDEGGAGAAGKYYTYQNLYTFQTEADNKCVIILAMDISVQKTKRVLNC